MEPGAILGTDGSQTTDRPDRLAERRGAQRVGERDARARRGAAERISAVRARSRRSRSRSASAACRVTAPATWSDPLLTTQ